MIGVWCVPQIMGLYSHTQEQPQPQQQFKVVSNVGHVMISMVVSFLLVTRVTTALSRYNEGQQYLTQMHQQARELTQRMVIVSSKTTSTQQQQTTTTGPQEWRNEVAHRTMLVLRTVVACMDYPTSKIPAWNVPELFTMAVRPSRLENESEIMTTTTTTTAPTTTTTISQPQTQVATPELSFIKNGLQHQIRRWSHHGGAGAVVEQEDDFWDTLRVPPRCAYLLRESILSQVERLPNPFPVQSEVMLLNSVDSMLNGFYGYVPVECLLFLIFRFIFVVTTC
jgi:Bestrophin, RFP-TM, chloride channel